MNFDPRTVREGSAALTAELTRLLVSDYTTKDGGRPFSGLAPAAVRKLILETPGFVEIVMRIAKEQADEEAGPQREQERVEVAHAGELVEDPGESRPLHLGRHEWNDQRDGEPRREGLEPPLHVVIITQEHESGVAAAQFG